MSSSLFLHPIGATRNTVTKDGFFLPSSSATTVFRISPFDDIERVIQWSSRSYSASEWKRSEPIIGRPLLESLRRDQRHTRRRKSTWNRPRQRRTSQMEFGRPTIDLRVPSPEHLLALRRAFEKILLERLHTDPISEQYQKVEQLIRSKQPDCQIEIYDSVLFDCRLKIPGMIDIDVQFSSADPLKELEEILRTSDDPRVNEVRIHRDHKPPCLEVTRLRVTCGFHRGVILSQLIFLYTKLDDRVLPLLRLFRILAKICNIDKPDLGTLHPMVFHLLVIHFLQQLDPAVLPCLHDEVFGADQLPLALNESNFDEFFRRAKDSSSKWKSVNQTPVELLFLQLLSYYVRMFPSNECIVSIQTRRSILKSDRTSNSQRLFVEDPTDLKRNLCQTMQAGRVVNYFWQTLSAALNYFGRKQKKTIAHLAEEEFIEVIVEDENEIPSIEPTNSLHHSYRLFSQRSSEMAMISEPASVTIDNEQIFYDFRAENFHAEQGAPFVCLICNAVGHLKSECPESFVPQLIDLPCISEDWSNTLSLLCQRITERCRPTAMDIEHRQTILRQLESQFQRDFPQCTLHAFGSFYNGFGFRRSDLDICVLVPDAQTEVMRTLLRSMQSNPSLFENVQFVSQARVPIIRSRHRRLKIDIDISLYNHLATENTRLLKLYTDIDPRVAQLGYMIKYLVKICDIGDASRGTLSSYAYILMLIYFLQQTQPAVLPVLQEIPSETSARMSGQWNVYFYDDLCRLRDELWKTDNRLSAGALWIEFLRFYTEQFDHEEQVVSIRQREVLFKHEKGWFRQTLAIEDPFELSHNLAGGLSTRNWTNVRRVFIRARQHFALSPGDFDLTTIESILFNTGDLCPPVFEDFSTGGSRVWTRPYSSKQCFQCGSVEHLRAQCTGLSIADTDH